MISLRPQPLVFLATVGFSVVASAQTQPDSDSSVVANSDHSPKDSGQTSKNTVKEGTSNGRSSKKPSVTIDPHAAIPQTMRQGPGRNLSNPSAAVPPGEIHVDVVGPRGEPFGGATVNLRTNFQSISQGNSDDVASKVADQNGKALFKDLDTALRFSYVVEVVRDGAKYSVPEFRLQKAGQQVLIHTYPTTTDQLEALVASRGYAHVQLREDFYRVDVMYRVSNAGQKTWLPREIRLDLPENAQAIDTSKRAGDTGFKELGGDVVLDGSYPPGNNDVQFSYQIPNQNTETLAFQMGVLPHLLDLTVLAQQAPGMTLTVPGFDRTETRPGPDGKPALFSGKNLRSRSTPLSSITIELGGLPVVGPGRWIAAALALLIALGGFLLSRSTGGKNETDEVKAEREQARHVLLDEMVLLERASTRGEIGPRTYEQTRREILLALARLEPEPVT